MTTQSPDMKKLREVAERATPGSWVASASDGETGHGFCAQVFCQNGPSIATMDHMGEQGTADAAYFATFNPQTILALLDELAALRKENEGLRADKDRLDWLDGQSEAYGFENYHEGNRWTLDGPFNTARQAIDATRDHFAARAAIGDSHE